MTNQLPNSQGSPNRNGSLRNISNGQNNNNHANNLNSAGNSSSSPSSNGISPNRSSFNQANNKSNNPFFNESQNPNNNSQNHANHNFPNPSQDLLHNPIKVIGLYDFHGQDNEDLPFKKGEILSVIEKQEAQWWTARNDRGSIGHIPVPYIKVLDSGESNNRNGSTRNKRSSVKNNNNNPKVLNVPNLHVVLIRRPANAYWEIF